MFAYVGCRTTRERNAKGEGIGVYAFDKDTGALELIDVVGGLANPSYLALDCTGRFLFTVHGDMGAVSAFAIDSTSGRIRHINTQPCGGRNPVHLTPSADNSRLLVANYATGSIGILPIATDGSLGPVQALHELPGEPGPHRTQQKGVHPHQVMYDPAQHFIAVPDKGGDKVAVLKLESDGAQPRLIQHSSVRSRQGAGPRHISFHPTLPFAYLANELDSTISTYGWDAAVGVLTPLQILPSTPETFFGDNTTAGIQVTPSGRFVYLSNRGHDSVAIFAVDPTSGRLRSVGWEPTLGEQPRFITLDPSGRFLYAANELSHTIVCFRIDERTGALQAKGSVVETGSPTCLVFNVS